MLKKQLADDTIVAAATPPGRGGIAIVKISGPLVKTLLQKQLKLSNPRPRYAYYVQLKDAQQCLLDDGLLLTFLAPHSYTGEDLLEFHGHGNPVIINQIITYFIDQGCRMAEPGEFTQRAYLNNKLDLLQAQAVADTIHASSEKAARAAVRALSGEFSKLVHALEADILQCRVAVEASIDFADQEIDFNSIQQHQTALAGAQKKLAHLLVRTTMGLQINQGLRIALIGPPNVGKSSLFNALCQKDAAIVTDKPGTTRDLLEQNMLIGDLPCALLDTAGIHATTDDIEQQGIRKALAALASADLILLMGDASQHTLSDMQAFWSQHIPGAQPDHRLCYLWNKTDLPSTIKHTQQPGPRLSILNKTGLDQLIKAIHDKIGLDPALSEEMIPAQQRHIDSLKRTQAELTQAQEHSQHPSFDLMAEHLKLAHQALSEMVGNSHHEAVLDEIFANFCIGK